MVENLGERAKVEGGTGQSIIGSQQEDRIMVTGGHV
jgi:hypothetical protein